MPALEVYWGSGSQPSWRVLLALEVKKVPYTSKLLSFQKAEHKEAGFETINPRRQVPALRHGDFTLYESLAILAYLEREFPDVPLFGSTAQETGLIWRVVLEFFNHLEPPLMKLVLAVFRGQIDTKRAEIDSLIPTIQDELAKLDDALADRDWLVGSRITAADVTVYPSLMGLERAGGKPEAMELDVSSKALRDRYPAIGAWCKRIEALPGYDTAYPPHWRE